MLKIKFTIPGNQEKKAGNPIPKIKLTQRQHWMPKAQRYQGWKDYVRQIFRAELKRLKLKPDWYKDWLKDEHPIILEKDQKAYMNIMIYWADETHADPESVFGSIADALFKNDKHLAGSMDYRCRFKDKESPRVEVIITI